METTGSTGVVASFNKMPTMCQVFYFISIFLESRCPYSPFEEEETGWGRTGGGVRILWTTDIVTVGSPKGLVGNHPWERKWETAEWARVAQFPAENWKPTTNSFRAQTAFCRSLPDGENGSCITTLISHWLEVTPRTAWPWLRSGGRPRRELTAGGRQLAIPLTAGPRCKWFILVSVRQSDFKARMTGANQCRMTSRKPQRVRLPKTLLSKCPLRTSH